MTELTEREIQEMIEKARAGDAEANYRMSEWALEQAVEEPEEERWNRLAAKCLVRAAEAGYAPAQKRMDELIRQLEDGAETRGAEQSERPQPARETPDDAPAPGGSVLTSVRQTLAGAAASVAGLFGRSDRGATVGAPADTRAGAHSGARAGGFLDRAASFFRFSDWGPEKTRRVQRISLIVCAALILLIIIIILSSRGGSAEQAEEEPQIPAAATAEPVQPTATPVVELYPDESIRTAIASANLEVFPEDADYVAQETKATVSTSGSDLNLRRGTAATYGQITTIPNGTSVDVYAYKSGWALVYYSGSYGWCSGDYLK